ncbi:MAG: membrane associated rhomboid family serine protease, partial [Myxococcota bacterium]
MFIIIPVGLDHHLRRGLPYATFALALILIGIFLLTRSPIEASQEAQAERASNIIEHWQAFPWVHVPDDVAKLIMEDHAVQRERQLRWTAEYDEDPTSAAEKIQQPDSRLGAGGMAILNAEAMGLSNGVPKILSDDEMGDVAKLAFWQLLRDTSRQWREDTEHQLVGLLDDFKSARLADPTYRYGYIPDKPTARGLFAHMFLHAGWLHLIMNILFFYLAAVALEDVWSAATLVGVYVACGVAGALVWGASSSAGAIPMVGASGAVAGLMGAFLVRLRQTNIRFVWSVFLVRWKSFNAPASLMLPLWIIAELMSAMFFSDMSNVAYWAHIGGFCAGVSIALVFKATQFEVVILGRDPDELADENPDEFRP